MKTRITSLAVPVGLQIVISGSVGVGLLCRCTYDLF